MVLTSQVDILWLSNVFFCSLIRLCNFYLDLKKDFMFIMIHVFLVCHVLPGKVLYLILFRSSHRILDTVDILIITLIAQAV